MSSIDPILEVVTGPGSPFAIVTDGDIRRFANAPRNLDQLIESGRRHGDNIFIVDGDKRLSFNEVFARRDALASQLDIETGERVALCMRNRAEWLIGFMAIIRAGGVAVLVNSRGSPEELNGAVTQVGARVVLADRSRIDLLREAQFEGRLIDADDFPIAADAPFVPRSIADPRDPAAILFTSGTGGQAKGAVLSHLNLITGIMSVQMSGMMVLHNRARQMGLEVEQLVANIPQQAVLLVYPLFHISGLGSAFLSPLLAGSKVVILPKWDAQDAARVIAEEKITMFSAVPTMLWDMLNRAKVDDFDLSSLRNIGTGGQALPINLLDEIRSICPQAVMGTGYGMTETAGSVAMAVGDDWMRNRAAAGRILPLIDVRIEAEDGSILPAGQAGEILVRGAQVMLGYWDMPEETAAAMTEDGWLRTGDVGFIDQEGYVFIVDRKKDMVISGGENIYCAEVERVLSELPQIAECATFGIPDERLGELLVAIVRGRGIDADDVKKHVGERLARYKAPGHVLFINAPLPRNHLDKVDKIALRARWPELSKDAS